MKRLFACMLLSVLLACSVVGAPTQEKARADYRSLIAVCLAFEPGDVTPAPKPPTPTPSDICPNCNGKGRLGDGTVSVTCPACDGTGKRKTAAPVCECPEGGTCICASCVKGGDCTCGKACNCSVEVKPQPAPKTQPPALNSPLGGGWFQKEGGWIYHPATGYWRHPQHGTYREVQQSFNNQQSQQSGSCST